MKRFLFLACVSVLVLEGLAAAEQSAYKKVKVRFNKSAKDRVLVDKDVDLILEDAGGRIIVRGQYQPLEVKYDDVTKVVLDLSTHMRGGGLSQAIGGLVGAAIASKKVDDYWCYVEYRKPDGSTGYHMLELDKENSGEIIDKLRANLGDRVHIMEFDEQADKIEKDTLEDLQSKHDLKVDKKQHPMPEIRPDKALVVVACPPLAARFAGKGNQFKLHANNQVVAVNKMGTYYFLYLDPGEYLLASQTENASGFKIDLEAGKDYYFLQNTFMGTWKAKTSLSRHSKELVMHEVGGAYWSDWKRKN